MKLVLLHILFHVEWIIGSLQEALNLYYIWFRSAYLLVCTLTHQQWIRCPCLWCPWYPKSIVMPMCPLDVWLLLCDLQGGKGTPGPKGDDGDAGDPGPDVSLLQTCPLLGVAPHSWSHFIFPQFLPGRERWQDVSHMSWFMGIFTSLFFIALFQHIMIYYIICFVF